jgi:hypothetical protein
LHHRPSDASGHVALARLLSERGDPAAAGHLRQALRLRPDDPATKKLLDEELKKQDKK